MTAPVGTKTLFRKIDTVLVRVQRLEDARKWYEEKLGFRAGFNDEAERLVVFDLGGETSLTIWEWKPGERPAGENTHWSYPIFYPIDIDEVRNHLEASGVQVGSIDGDGRGTRWFSFWDLDGNRLEVCQYPTVSR